MRYCCTEHQKAAWKLGHRHSCCVKPLPTPAIVASAVAVASAIALALGPVVTPAPAVADPGIETEQRIVFGDHSGHVGYEP